MKDKWPGKNSRVYSHLSTGTDSSELCEAAWEWQNRDGRGTTSLHLLITADGNEVNTHVNNSPGMKLRF